MIPKPDGTKDRRRRKRLIKSERAQFREQVLARDGTCMDMNCPCHKQLGGILDPHHIDYLSQVTDNSVDNGITLCRYIAHRKVQEGYYRDAQFVSPDEAMLEILEPHRGTLRWRWDDQYKRLKTKVAA